MSELEKAIQTIESALAASLAQIPHSGKLNDMARNEIENAKKALADLKACASQYLAIEQENQTLKGFALSLFGSEGEDGCKATYCQITRKVIIEVKPDVFHSVKADISDCACLKMLQSQLPSPEGQNDVQ